MTVTEPRARPAPPNQPRGTGPSRPFLRRRTTWLAAAVLVATAVVAIVVQGSPSSSSVAARVGSAVITDSSVNQEVGAIEAQPEYQAALQNASTLALAAPVSPQALASANGDPDDLRVSLVPVGGAALTRRYTIEDLRAAVLTRLLYLSALRQLLAARHVRPTSAQLLDGRQEARVRSGIDTTGASLFDRLPAWYQDQLAQRGADVEALTDTIVGRGVTPSALQAAYDQRRAADYTTVCLRAVVVAPQDEAAGRAQLLAGAPGSLDVGCASVGTWTPAAAAAFGAVPVGEVSAPLVRGNRATLILVTRRTVAPLSAVAGDVKAALDSRYTDLVNTLVEDQLGVSNVQVAAHYGTYESLGDVHNILPADALTPPAGAGSSGTSTTNPPQRPDPFD